jgi:hypothetical protein
MSHDAARSEIRIPISLTGLLELRLEIEMKRLRDLQSGFTLSEADSLDKERWLRFMIRQQLDACASLRDVTQKLSQAI